MKILSSPLLATFSSLTHAFSTRQGGESLGPFAALNLSDACGDDPVNVSKNRQILCDRLGMFPDQLCVMKQVHGINIHHFEKPCPVPEADISMTDQRGLTLVVQTADCLPILLFDPKRPAIAVIHGGWRGIAAGVIERGVSAMQSAFRTDSADLSIAVGPRIGPCCFEVGAEVLEALEVDSHSLHLQKGENVGDRPGKSQYFIDLAGVARQRFIALGIEDDQMDLLPQCTSCSRDLFSYRREGGLTGRQWGVIQLD